MTSYDSDSSGAEDDFTETTVLLGYATKDQTDDNVSHLGGQPEWLDSSTAPNGASAKCLTCNSYLSLLLQLNGDMPGTFPGHERRLYVWTCRKKTCRRKDGSIRAIRGIRVSKDAAAKAQKSKPAPEPEPEPEPKKPQMGLGESLFGAKPLTAGSANPFSASSSANPFSSSSQSSNPFASTSSLAAKPPQQPTSTLPETFASKLRISSPASSSTSSRLPARPHEPWPSPSSFPAPFPTYNLDADYETLDAEKRMPPQNVRMDVDVDKDGEGSSKDAKGEYESEIDKTFQKFADRLAQNPEQVLRYEFRGQPLLYSKTDAVGQKLSGKAGMTRCGNCGADRVFEVQLTPHAIMELEAEEEGLEGMEWGTIVVGVCAKDCTPSDVAAGGVGYLEEWVGVQWEQIRK